MEALITLGAFAGAVVFVVLVAFWASEHRGELTAQGDSQTTARTAYLGFGILLPLYFGGLILALLLG